MKNQVCVENAHVLFPLLATTGAARSDELRRVSFEFFEKTVLFLKLHTTIVTCRTVFT